MLLSYSFVPPVSSMGKRPFHFFSSRPKSNVVEAAFRPESVREYGATFHPIRSFEAVFRSTALKAEALGRGQILTRDFCFSGVHSPTDGMQVSC